MTYELIESTELTSSVNSIEFTSIPQDGTDLVIKFSGRIDSAGAVGALVTFNGLSTDYSGARGIGNGTSVFFGAESSLRLNTGSTNDTSSTFSNASLYIFNYSSNSAKLNCYDGVTENNGTAAQQRIMSIVWDDTSAISSILIDASTNNFVAGTVASLYKITAA